MTENQKDILWLLDDLERLINKEETLTRLNKNVFVNYIISIRQFVISKGWTK